MVAGRPDEVAPGVRRVLAPNPGPMTGPGTNTYLVGGPVPAVIDPGPDDPAHFDAVMAAAGGDLSAVLVTHTHLDHSPLARRLREATGAPVVAYGPAPSQPTPGLDTHEAGFAPDRQVPSGQTVPVAGVTFTALHTPGHTANHLCFALGDLLFSGDHVMSGSTVVICPPDGDMGDYLASLRAVRRLAPARIAPGHGPMIDDPLAVLDYYLAHRVDRERAVAGALRAAGRSGARPADRVAAVYADVPSSLHPVALYSLWAHLRHLGQQGRAATSDADDPEGRWWPEGASRRP
jgi:glyoxylase-like metal-dependent hydrolase (beta-lactamase superfamily II)